MAKKTQVNSSKEGKNIIGAVILVMVVVLISAIAALIVGSVLGSEVFSGSSGSSVENLTAVDNITTQSFSILSTDSFATCTLLAVQNSTSGTALTSGNYTQPTGCSILATESSEFIGFNWEVNYTFVRPGSAGVAINITTLTTGFGAFISGIVIFLAVIGIIVGVMWLVSYIRPLFSKEDGIQSFDQT